MPAQQRLGADQLRRPGRARQHAAKGREQTDKAIHRLPAGAPDLAFEYAELVAKGQDLGWSRSSDWAASKECVEEEADEGVEVCAEHGGGAWQRPVRSASPYARCSGSESAHVGGRRSD
jgi:hypothetical protein